MRYLIAAFILLLAPLALADSVARNGSDWVRLTLKPCEDTAIAAVMAKQGLNPLDFRAGTANFNGKDYALCWMPVNGGAGLVFDDGDAGFVGSDQLKAVPEA